MDFKVIRPESAIADLKDICEYIALDNRSAAGTVGRGILDHVKILETFPFVGPAYPRRSNGSVREIVYRKYRIFYDVTDKPKSVHILRVWHGARGEPELR
jgi:toxin ParE1/3/4